MPFRPSMRVATRDAALGIALACGAPIATAALPVGAAAPEFRTEAALAGKVESFDLREALAQGPVVLYFFPKAFTSGCTLEAHAFAQAQPQFAAAGARVVGISNDGIEVLKRFSTEACRSAFTVASDRESRVIRAYDAGLAFKPDMADRISYVIGRDGRIALVHAAMNPVGHVEQTLKAVEQMAKTAARTAPAAAPTTASSPRP